MELFQRLPNLSSLLKDTAEYQEQIQPKSATPLTSPNDPQNLITQIQNKYGIHKNLQSSFNKQADDVYKKMNILQNEKNEFLIGPLNKINIQKKERKRQKEKQTSKDWFSMQKVEDEELKQSLQAIRLRQFVDPKKFYKRNDFANSLPKYFQVGTLIESNIDGKDKRLTKRERKQNIAEELEENDRNINYSKRRFNEIQKYRENIAKKKSILKKSIKKRKHK